MIRLQLARLMFVLLLIVCSTTVLSAQAWDAYVFAGANGRSTRAVQGVDDSKIPSGLIAGGKIGGFMGDNFSLDGGLSWYGHFLPSATPDFVVFRPLDILNPDGPKVHALLWEASGNYNFGEHNVGTRWTPYVVFGVGGVTARIKDSATDSVFVSGGGFIKNPLYVNAGSPVPQFIVNPARQIILDNNDTFFTFSYGGGIKALRLAGPVGFRFDIRGRTIPNFFGKSVTMPEYTGGLAFAWGER